MKKGTQIIYIPNHAEDKNHPDAETGFVFGECKDPRSVFCRYWSKRNPFELRTKANSEATPVNCLFVKDTRPQSFINDTIKKIEMEALNG